MEKLFLDHPWIIILILLWTLPWKGAALWRAARRGHIGWFLTLIILNTLGILDILYIFVFANWGKGKKEEQERQIEKNPQPGVQVRQSKFSSSSKSRQTIV
ncbi:MAG: hypothetical protein US57_C0015G0023 [Candidatus Moranbacteria bacterium GW2011_GWC2_37_73]|nr:MAG: hypothetical protein UR95_C0006G0023 [Parcubacteria group bacterium GW2011_GWC1_36_108]KKP99982.1 MAG: hypothetical protein US09_C0026G0027 [Candidatus Moranbacteria bacterium GW2011_GWD1_36_198]KKQ00249.1 MAG: hypothetical protein US10_C0037G0004 [Candidatus Moranbacteria bacterium GW2011_GWD2_36_198]KKQ39333.1 MAG: hypothetical protein US57_C0015G0023 [Candidatus Moranbacteria bacterium GW2011_GWC2_37_73]HAR99899.1 hypothetical protein [Candidatus Moranbacteria bacterium]